jgi:hypothetical protein
VLLACLGAAAAHAQPGEDPLSFVRFVEDDDANCVMREGRMILVRSIHPTRIVRAWIERHHMGKPTGDRSRSELPPGAEPEKLGCSRTQYGKQEWIAVKAQFVE